MERSGMFKTMDDQVGEGLISKSMSHQVNTTEKEVLQNNLEQTDSPVKA